MDPYDCQANLFCSKSSTLTGVVVILLEEQCQLLNQRLALQCMHFDLVLLDFLQEGEDTEEALLFLDQIKREKGVWWMPWQ